MVSKPNGSAGTTRAGWAAPIGTITAFADLVPIARQRMVELDVTFETLDEVSGLTGGYSSKLLSPNPNPIKRFAPLSFFLILRALGLKLLVVEDADQMTKLRPRLTKRRIRRPTSPHWRNRGSATACPP